MFLNQNNSYSLKKQTHAWLFPLGLPIVSNQYDIKRTQDYKGLSRPVRGRRVMVWSFSLSSLYLFETWPSFHYFSLSILIFYFQMTHSIILSTNHWMSLLFCSLQLYFNNSLIFIYLFFLYGGVPSFSTQYFKGWIYQTSWFSSFSPQP